MLVRNKVIVLTGAGSGMGRELALLLLKRGARVAAVDLSEDALNETKKLAGENASELSCHILNITNKAAIFSLPEEVISIHGAVDGLINNAGIIQPFVDVKDLSDEQIDKLMQVNFTGSLNMIRAFLPFLLERPEAHIANVSSMGGFIPFPGQTIYGASKAALKLLTEGLYAELKDTKVGVTVIHPGAVNTNIAKNSGVEIKGMEDQASAYKALPASKAAEIMVKAIEKNKFRVMVGNDARFLDLFYRLCPAWAVRFIVKQMSNLKSR